MENEKKEELKSFLELIIEKYPPTGYVHHWENKLKSIEDQINNQHNG